MENNESCNSQGIKPETKLFTVDNREYTVCVRCAYFKVIGELKFQMRGIDTIKDLKITFLNKMEKEISDTWDINLNVKMLDIYRGFGAYSLDCHNFVQKINELQLEPFRDSSRLCDENAVSYQSFVIVPKFQFDITIVEFSCLRLFGDFVLFFFFFVCFPPTPCIVFVQLANVCVGCFYFDVNCPWARRN